MKRLLTLLLAACATAAAAEPAPWYWWTSKIDGQRTCAQYMPAQGWTRSQGPFQDARCTKAAVRK